MIVSKLVCEVFEEVQSTSRQTEKELPSTKRFRRSRGKLVEVVGGDTEVLFKKALQDSRRIANLKEDTTSQYTGRKNKKRPNAFMLWSQGKRKDLINKGRVEYDSTLGQYRTITTPVTEVSIQLGGEWNKMSETEKAPYFEEAARLQSLPDENVQADINQKLKKPKGSRPIQESLSVLDYMDLDFVPPCKAARITYKPKPRIIEEAIIPGPKGPVGVNVKKEDQEREISELEELQSMETPDIDLPESGNPKPTASVVSLNLTEIRGFDGKCRPLEEYVQTSLR